MSEAPLPESVARFRAEFRQKEPGRHYRGWGHFAFTSLGSLAVITFALSRLTEVRPLEWLMVPATFLVANTAEYFGHRGPMHHRRRGLGLVYRRHTQQHHHFFTEEAMAYESSHDFRMVLFPPVLLLFFLGGIATPLGALLFALGTPNLGWLFVATAMGYFLTYEWLHFCYHLPAGHPVARLPVMGKLRRHHEVHHDLRKMGRYHFNITFPLWDRLMGTMWRSPGPLEGKQPP
ncbi:sterol desaturase family protein [Hyalangium rubrum]|uniref:Sterol desaturase family protein n=1 Tax=Hyalangium rubrum TaxID=3103134 RepID=A0ABU5HF66_9BACT|nr:sterol desaturase family protein [Hyalangium sp. s54d21]MDY7231448.1 sterol desaturase family protein [Hyalangium sp. s54d21]